MSNLLLVLMMMVTLVVPLVGPRNRPPVAVADQYFLLFYPAPVVEIPVLVNDSDPDGDVLHLTALLGTQGGTAQILDDGAVRVYLDWSREAYEPEGLVASGTYIVSDGTAGSTAVWSVWYWPFMLP